ncbi:MAG: MarR family transcriptional regulator [Austwickia sp.]|jgi:DNA-binding MarR family transcriptional regulator|nr:MarR family transcriptional regulator [Austwickia sp.]MBK8436650.1 MarR family transcriptional regulator [Austwickia sp.]MBK9100282.1 MarR family transcriptional regulator [Austwickia sp.]
MQTVAWLSSDELVAWRTFLQGATLLNETLDRDLQVHGVSLSEYDILVSLSEATGRRLRMSTLAQQVVQSRSRLTHTAARLERRGWVQRRPAPDDRRGVELFLTDTGYAAIQALAPIHVASVRRHLLDRISLEQLQVMGEAMAVVRAGILGDLDDERLTGT